MGLVLTFQRKNTLNWHDTQLLKKTTKACSVHFMIVAQFKPGHFEEKNDLFEGNFPGVCAAITVLVQP